MRILSSIALLLFLALILLFSLFVCRGYASTPRTQIAKDVELNPIIRSDEEVLGEWLGNNEKLILLADKTFSYEFSKKLLAGTWERQDFTLQLKGNKDVCCDPMRFVRLHDQYHLLTHPPDFSAIEGRRWLDTAIVSALYKAKKPAFPGVLDPLVKIISNDHQPPKSDLSPEVVEIMALFLKAQGGDAAALDNLKSKAVQGNPEAQIYMGSLYDGSMGGTRRDDAEALRWYLKAAGQEDCEAQKILNEMYYNGRGVKKDLVKAEKWLLKSWDNGCPRTKNQTEQYYEDLNEGHWTAEQKAAWIKRAHKWQPVKDTSPQ